MVGDMIGETTGKRIVRRVLSMRLTAVIILTLLAAAPASAQYPYDLDPYKPSDAAWLRTYGATLVAQTPLLELRRLDPYVPSQAALLRQLGGAMPWWVGWYLPFSPPPTFAPLTPFPRTQAVIPSRPSVVVITVAPNARPLLPQRQDRQREPDQLRRPELRPVPPRNPGFRAAQPAGSYSQLARRVLFFARYEATELGSDIVEPEHMVLGMIREGKGMTAQIFDPSGVPPQSIRREIERQMTVGPRISTSPEVSFSPASKRVLEFAAEEADRLLHNAVGPEHLLLGILREEGSVAASILAAQGMRFTTVRAGIAGLPNEKQ